MKVPGWWRWKIVRGILSECQTIKKGKKKKPTKKQDICKPMLTSNTPCSYMNIQNKKSQH